MRMQIDCEMTYRLAASGTATAGRCRNLSAVGLAFIAGEQVDTGQALEIRLANKTGVSPGMTAFAEVVRCNRLEDGSYETAAIIKGIKGL